MRLLNTSTLELEEFVDERPGRYAILSHRWEGEEISYQDYTSNRKLEGPGLDKIHNLCSLASSRGHRWAWIDTCCIDKKSSAELSEAINSMFRYYMKAAECFAYLSDVPALSSVPDWSAFRESSWFTRGWTLQELLAPSQITFFDQDWQMIGNKRALEAIISEITGIPRPCLSSRKQMYEASIAIRMSWASRRETTRKEDMAYCLMGLFDVNMALLYGEGKKAFLRLQLEIIRKSHDESIFAWKTNEPIWGLLAPSPRAFVDSAHIVQYQSSVWSRPTPFAMTNQGLKLRKVPYPRNSEHRESLGLHPDDELLMLKCHGHTAPNGFCLIVVLRMIDDQWYRVQCHKLEHAEIVFSSLQHRRKGATPVFIAQPGI